MPRRQGRHHSRLQDTVATCDAPASRVYLWCVQGVCRNRHQLAQRARGQCSVAVECQYVTDTFIQLHAAVQRGKRRGPVFGQLAQQHFKFAALAFPAYPAPFGG